MPYSVAAARGGKSSSSVSVDLNAYANEIVSLFGANIISYLPLWESSGAFADDYTANNRDGAYSASGITYGETGVGDGRTSVKLDGTNGRINWYSAGLAGAFNNAEGTVAIWAKVSAAGIWTDGLNHDLMSIRANGSNLITIAKKSVNGRLEFTYLAGGTQEQYRREGSNETGWMHICMTWSKSNDRARFYINGTQANATTGLGTWSGALASNQVAIGIADTNTVSNLWSGWLAHAVLLNREATGTEVADLASLPF